MTENILNIFILDNYFILLSFKLVLLIVILFYFITSCFAVLLFYTMTIKDLNLESEAATGCACRSPRHQGDVTRPSDDIITLTALLQTDDVKLTHNFPHSCFRLCCTHTHTHTHTQVSCMQLSVKTVSCL